MEIKTPKISTKKMPVVGDGHLTNSNVILQFDET